MIVSFGLNTNAIIGLWKRLPSGSRILITDTMEVEKVGGVVRTCFRETSEGRHVNDVERDLDTSSSLRAG